nr:immunoglobulin heavy chain junction region [Macaca mulatta]MOX01217.1 immunoglobulin heavy chain junction region [Macaca mulatta]MOX03662.1 immunoglobulin heavy chain junction region [Macaca mulatta]MOX03771.1 immunoglobulin heavy chain junction region [Macaca mulatta]MOX06077.1 immunoglobulin heavy chain junction region [Macaca mulatta]
CARTLEFCTGSGCHNSLDVW